MEDTQLTEQLLEAVNAEDPGEVRQKLAENRDFLKDNIKFTSKLFRMALYSERQEVIVDVAKFVAEFVPGIDFELLLETTLARGDAKSAEVLLRNGAKLEDRNMTSTLSYVLGLMHGPDDDLRKEMVSLLVKYSPVFGKLQEAEKQKLIETLDAKVDQNAAVVEIAEILSNSGVPFDGLDYHHSTLLHESIRKKNYDLVRFLIEKGGVDVNKRNNQGDHPLYSAALYDQADIVDLLLDKGAPINAGNCRNETALHIACRYNFERVIDLLIQRGADTNAENAEGKTPFSVLNAKAQPAYDACARLLVKEFAKMSLGDVPVGEKNMALVRKTPGYSDYFEKCKSELAEDEK